VLTDADRDDYVVAARTAAASNFVPSSLFLSDVAPIITAQIPPCCATFTTRRGNAPIGPMRITSKVRKGRWVR
jgi:hypothetical protein